MSESTHRQQRNEKTFEDLPPRVVIYDILNCIEIKLDSSIGEFDLFGYYKRDRPRRVWFLFQSLDFSILLDDDLEDNSTFPVVKIEKLHSLQWSENSNFKSFVDTFKRTNMYLLKRMSVSNLLCVSLNGLFSSQNRFPKLTHLEIDTDLITEDWNWDVDRIKSLQETLTSLDVFIDCDEDLISPDDKFLLLGNNVTFSSLKKVSFVSIQFTKQRRIQLPQLEEVCLSGCRNLVFIPGSNVSSVTLSRIPPNDIRELFLRSKRIKHIELQSLELFNKSNNWFYEESTNPMEHLQSMVLKAYYDRNENFETFLERIKDQLIKFEVHWSSMIQEDILESGFEKLEVLNICDTEQLLQNETKWDCSSHLKELTISEISDDTFFRSVLFKNNHFSSLVILNILFSSYAETSLSSESFAPLKNLKELTISSSKIGDIFFAEQDFENLEVLKVDNCGILFVQRTVLTGKGWKRKRFNKLRVVRVGQNAVSDTLFQLVEFPALRKLEFEDCNLIAGEGWLEMPSLCEFILCRSEGFSNEKILKLQKNGVNFVLQK